jgi:hypothetical protein
LKLEKLGVAAAERHRLPAAALFLNARVCQSELLTLSSRKTRPTLTPAHHLIVAVRHPIDDIFCKVLESRELDVSSLP